MELKIYSPQDAGFIQKIDWNFEELKTEISAVAQEYETSVYTDDTIGDAKADRAKLNKFKDALTGKRTEIRKKLLEPDELFGQQVKELTGIVQKAIDNIDGQVKGYEERKRNEKLDKVREFYEDNIQDLAEYLPWDRVVKPEYGNASKTMKSIKEEILALIQKVPTPITPVRIDKERRHITLAYFDKVSTVDYIGAVQGIPICFDAKECAADTFPLQNVHEHQVSFMEKYEKQQGISFLIIYYSQKETLYYMRFEELLKFWKRAQSGGRKSIRFEELSPEYFMALKNHCFVPYLDYIQKDLDDRD